MEKAEVIEWKWEWQHSALKEVRRGARMESWDIPIVLFKLLFSKDTGKEWSQNSLKLIRNLRYHRKINVPKGGYSPILWFQVKYQETPLRYFMERTCMELARYIYGRITGGLGKSKGKEMWRNIWERRKGKNEKGGREGRNRSKEKIDLYKVFVSKWKRHNNLINR